MSQNVIDLEALANAARNYPLFQKVQRNEQEYNSNEILDALVVLGKKRREKFTIDEENRSAYESAAKWLAGDHSMLAIDPDDGTQIAGDINLGLYVGGITGSGKSWLLELLSTLGAMLGIRCTVASKELMLTYGSIQASSIVTEYTTTGYDVIKHYATQPILCIQDFGAEQQEALYMGNRVNVIGQILEMRGDRSDLLTIISSNLRMDGDKLKTIYGDRVASRLKEMCNYLIVSNLDRRTI